jgi:3-hexulose-6-phosphate synthase
VECVRINSETLQRASGDLVCAGSILIKSMGIGVLQSMGGSRIADMKIMDTGHLEAEMAHNAGAHYVTVSSVAEDSTIKKALECSQERGIDVIGDLLGAEERRKRLEDLGVRDFLSGSTLTIDGKTASLKEVYRPVEGIVRTRAVDVDAPKLQIALDLLSTSQAVSIADKAVRGGVDWIEAGTPLIKKEGMGAVRALRKRFDDAVIVADLKTLEHGRDETILACKNGADIVGICGSASDTVIKEAVGTGAVIMADLIAAKDPAKRAKELEALGVSMLEFHLAIDVQGGEYPFEALRAVCDAASIPVGCAGGMDASKVRSALDCGASFIVAGSSLTKADDTRKEAERIKASMGEA